MSNIKKFGSFINENSQYDEFRTLLAGFKNRFNEALAAYKAGITLDNYENIKNAKAFRTALFPLSGDVETQMRKVTALNEELYEAGKEDSELDVLDAEYTKFYTFVDDSYDKLKEIIDLYSKLHDYEDAFDYGK